MIIQNSNSQNNNDKIRSNTYLAYIGTLKRYSATVNDPELSKESIVLHLQLLRKAGYKPSVINFDFERLSAEYLSRARDDLAERKKELKKIKNVFYTKNLNSNYSVKSIDEDDIQKLIDNCPLRLSLIIEALVTTGLRISELLSIRVSDEEKLLSNEQVTYFSIIGKGNKYRKVFILNEILDRIKSTYRGKTYLFESVLKNKMNSNYVTREINKHSGKLIGKNIHAHTLRHSFITISIKNGVPIDAISRAVGHSSVSFTLSKYSHNVYTPEMAKILFKGKS
jgi:integrase